jgi:hypothetical protein
MQTVTPRLLAQARVVDCYTFLERKLITGVILKS